LILSSLFLICLVLIQRGKGGGLAGAFGGMGGSSAFGTKAGDVFTRVTMITALVWILLSMILVVLYNRGTTSAWDEGGTRTSGSRTKEVAPTGTGTGAKKAMPPGSGKDKEATRVPGPAPAPVSAPVPGPEPKAGEGTGTAKPSPPSVPLPPPVSAPPIPEK
jgi:preprotein translocase subunit SecG